MGGVRILLVVVFGCLLLSGAGCDFEQPEPPCTFLCGGDDDDACPDGYECVEATTEDESSTCVRDDLVDDGLAACSEPSE